LQNFKLKFTWISIGNSGHFPIGFQLVAAGDVGFYLFIEFIDTLYVLTDLQIDLIAKLAPTALQSGIAK